MKGTVFSIEEFSTYNGDGIRTTVFLKGCPLRCSWCHNPEGQSTRPEMIKNQTGCLHCGACLDEQGRLTDAGVERCPKNLLRRCGVVYTPEELTEKLLKNKEMLDATGGGATFSGGEPLFQPEFLTECLTLLEGKLHRAVQTSGFATPKVFQAVLERTDYFLYDLKIFDEELHRAFTGASNRTILENFRTLAASGVPFCVRIPLIPTVTDTPENLGAIGEFLLENGVSYAELLPYNTFAGSKYPLIGKTYTPGFSEETAPDPHPELWEKLGIQIRIL